MSETTHIKTAGREADLKNGGKVYYGRSDEIPDEHFFKFTNSEGHETHLRLTDEATKALEALLTGGQPRAKWVLMTSSESASHDG